MIDAAEQLLALIERTNTLAVVQILKMPSGARTHCLSVTAPPLDADRYAERFSSWVVTTIAVIVFYLIQMMQRGPR